MYFRLLHSNAPKLSVVSEIAMSNKAVPAQKVYNNRALYQNPVYKTVFSDAHTMNHTILQRMSSFIPKNQYDYPNTFAWTWQGMLYHWESMPVLLSIVFGFVLAACSCVWACLHKMDLVFKGDYQNCLSRTMDLRNPKVHKLMQVDSYEPWPEMQEVLDAMRAVEQVQNFQACECDACAHSDENEECDVD